MGSIKNYLTFEEVKNIFSYNPDTGDLTWCFRGRTMFTSDRHASRWNDRYAGLKAGCVAKDGYQVLTFKGRQYYAHRIAWLLRTGKWPSLQIDHIDGDRYNNRFINLRLATAAQNAQNRVVYRTNKSGYQGVSICGNRYLAQIKCGEDHLQLGLCDNAAEAHELYLAAKVRLHKFQPVPRSHL